MGCLLLDCCGMAFGVYGRDIVVRANQSTVFLLVLIYIPRRACKSGFVCLRW
jgi:hypothetical protein